MEAVTIREYSGIRVVRDDLIGPGGTKTILMPELTRYKNREFVYASTVYGGLQIALSEHCRKIGKKAVIFCAKRGTMFRNTRLCKELGAAIKEVDNGMLSVVTKRAKDYCLEHDAHLIEFGGKNEVCKNLLVARIKKVFKVLGHEPSEIWCVVGSGMLIECLLEATAKAKLCAVKVSDSGYSIAHKRIRMYKYPKPFGFESRFEAGFPSMRNYDLKGFEMCTAFHKSKDTLFWNVAG